MSCIPRESFVPREYLNQLTCSIGLGIFNSPVALPCQHVFCKSCIEAWLAKNGTCPKCREAFQKDSLKPQWIFATIIKNATVFCSNTGCKWSGSYDSLEQHLTAECGKTICFCSLGCGKQMAREELVKHSALCEYRKVACKHCGILYPFQSVDAHETNCFRSLVACPKGCGKRMLASQLELHIKEECDLGDLMCKFRKTAGCEFVGTKEKLALHYAASQELHLRLLAANVFGLYERIEQYEKSRRTTAPEPEICSKGEAGGGADIVDLSWSTGSKKVFGSQRGGWSFFLSNKTIKSEFRARVRVAELNPHDGNAWKICLGVFGSALFQAGSWGKYKNGWGYIIGNGYKVSTEALAYGERCTEGDTITIEYRNKEVTFYKNGVNQGCAYRGIEGPLYLAVAISDLGHAVEITGVGN